MAKKRRTKAQKIRAQLRRSDAPVQLLPSAPPVTHKAQASADEAPLSVSETQSPSKEPVKPAMRPSRTAGRPASVAAAKPKRQLDLRLSLILLGVLVAAQLILWLVFWLTPLDEAIYNLVKI